MLRFSNREYKSTGIVQSSDRGPLERCFIPLFYCKHVRNSSVQCLHWMLLRMRGENAAKYSTSNGSKPLGSTEMIMKNDMFLG